MKGRPLGLSGLCGKWLSGNLCLLQFLQFLSPLAARRASLPSTSPQAPRRSRSPLITPERSGRRPVRTSTARGTAATAGSGMAHTGAIGVAFLEKRVVVVDGTHVGVGGFGAARLAQHPAGRPIVAITSPYYRTNRLYGLDSERAALALGARRPAVGPAAGRGPSVRLWRDLGGARRPAEGGRGLRGVRAARGSGARPTSARPSRGSRRRRMRRPSRRRPTTTSASLSPTTRASRSRRPAAARSGAWRDMAGVTAVAFDLRNYLICYAATGRTLLRSADGGVTWSIPR